MPSYIFKYVCYILNFKHTKRDMFSKCVGHFYKRHSCAYIYIIIMYIKLSFRKFLKEYLNYVIPLGECVFEADTHNPIILIHFHFSSSQVPNWFQSLVPGSRKKISIEDFNRSWENSECSRKKKVRERTVVSFAHGFLLCDLQFHNLHQADRCQRIVYHYNCIFIFSLSKL